MLARQLEMKSIPVGVFLELDSEKLKMTLFREGDAVRVYLHSTITGEAVSSGALIPPEGKWDVDSVLENFKEEMIDFVSAYFGSVDDSEERVLDFDELIDDMKRILTDISKSK